MYISEVLPRIDVERRDLLELNSIIEGVCEMYGATFIPSTSVISKISARNYWFDHLHLSDFGTAKLLKIYNKFVPVIKAKEAKSSCFNCGENGHNTKRCHHRGKLQCYACHEFGHKAKFCPY